MTQVKFAQIEPTTRCNFSCAFCVGRFMAQRDIATDTFEAALDLCDDLERVELQGEGEPLLHREFFDMAAKVRDKGALISMITNGSLLSPKRVAKLVSLPIERIGVSIESPDDERFSDIRGGKLDKVKAGLRRLKAARDARPGPLPAIGLNVTVLKSTLAEFEEIVALYKELGLDGGIGIQGLQDMGDYTAVYDPATRSEMLSEAELDAVAQLRNRVQADTALDLSQQDVGFFNALFAEFWDRPTTCPWLEKSIYVATDGHAMPCCHVKDQRWSFGQVDGPDRDHILENRDKMRAALDAGQPMAPCQSCWVTEAIAAFNVPQQPIPRDARLAQEAFS